MSEPEPTAPEAPAPREAPAAAPAAPATPAELSPPILKLHRLRLIAAELLGAAARVSLLVQDARNRRATVAREKRELEEQRTGNVALRENIRQRVERAGVTLAYADAEIRAADERHLQLAEQANEAAATADKYAGHLRGELAALGLKS